MKKLYDTFEENLRFFELAKLKRKYEKLGYIFSDNITRKRGGETIQFDGHAINIEKTEEYFFEVISLGDGKTKSNKTIIEKRKKCLKYFPKARFIIVFAREFEEPQIEVSDLNKILLDFIISEYSDNLTAEISFSEKRLFSGMTEFKAETIEDLSMTMLDLRDFKTIRIEGFANLRFWHYIVQEEFRGMALSDGIPFYFDIELFEQNKSEIEEVYPDYKYGIQRKKSKIKFDFSEFNKQSSFK